ncbi:MAG: sensor domain-containing diguanylate cyclase [Lentisphaerota bacterium]
MSEIQINFKDIFDNITDGIYITDTKRRILYWNKGAEEITGFSKEEVINSHCYDNLLVHVDGEGNNLCHGLCPLAASMKEGTCSKGEIYLHHKDGHRKPVLVRVVPIRDGDGKICAGAEFFTELPNEKAFTLRMQELEKLSYIDQLTQLPNRRYAEEQIKSKLSEHERLSMPFGLLFLDIDHFKSFNDNYGHEEGDKILKVIGRTLKSNSRPYDVYARWGGEEFVGIISGVTNESLKTIANKIRLLIKSSEVTINGISHYVTVSIGGAVSMSGESLPSLIKRADKLMYESKNDGRNRVTI